MAINKDNMTKILKKYHEKNIELTNGINENVKANSELITTIENGCINSVADIEIKGRTLINLLGKTGNAIYKQADRIYKSNIDLSYNGDEFILKSQDATGSMIMGSFGIEHINKNFKAGKAYIGVAQAKMEAGIRAGIHIYGDGIKENRLETLNVETVLYSSCIVPASGNIYFDIYCEAGTAQTLKLKDIRLYEISKEEYDNLTNMTPLEISAKYPYVDDIKCIVNPFLESKENLLENIPFGYYSYSGVDFLGDGITAIDHFGTGAYVYVEPNTTYTIYNPFKNKQVYTSNSGWHPFGQNLTFMTGPETYRICVLFGGIDAGDSYTLQEGNDICLKKWKSKELVPTMVKGEIAKTYDQCNNSRIMFETSLHSGETIKKSNNGSYIKNSLFEERSISEIIDAEHFIIRSGGTGYKMFCIDNLTYYTNSTTDTKTDRDNIHLVRYDGKIVDHCDDSNLWSACNQELWHFGGYGPSNPNNCLWLILPNSLTGWGDVYTPNNNEIKAFFLGWRMYRATEAGYGSSQQYDDANGMRLKGWQKLWSGVGTAVDMGVNIISGSQVHSCPTEVNDQGYIPYKLICKKDKANIEEVKTYGNLVVKKDVNVVCDSGLVLCEKNNGFVQGNKVYFNETYRPFPTYRVEEILKVKSNDELQDFYRYSFSFNATGTQRVIQGVRQARWDYTNNNNYAYVDYLIYKPDTVSNYDYTLKIGNSVNEIIDQTNFDILNCYSELAETKKQLELAKNELKVMSNPNILINGDFQIWQRGLSFTSNPIKKYACDRWNAFNGISYSAQVSRLNYYTGGLKVKTTAEYNVVLDQPIENLEYGTYTMSVLTKAGLYKKTFKYTSGTTSHSCTTDFGNLVFGKTSGIFSNLPYIQLVFNQTGNTYDVKWVKLEKGEYATQFIPRTYGEELRDCQRYYERLECTNGRQNLSAFGYTTEQARAMWTFKESKRTIPTIKVSGFWRILPHGTGVTVAQTELTKDIATLGITGTTFVSGYAYCLQQGDGAEATWGIEADAEIY